MVHIFAVIHLGVLWHSGLNEFPSCRLFLYDVRSKRYDQFLGLFPD